jgi:Flp pilus assembly protein TadG
VIVALFRRTRSTRDQHGSTSLELVLLAPFLLSVFLLVAAFGRHGHVASVINQAATDAGRSATAARSWESARTAVENVIDADLESAPKSCQDSEGHDVITSQGDRFVASDPYDPDGVNFLTVTVWCDVDMSDLSFVGIGTMHIEQSFTSPMPGNYGVY